jgi:hypothetical protein
MDKRGNAFSAGNSASGLCGVESGGAGGATILIDGTRLQPVHWWYL